MFVEDHHVSFVAQLLRLFRGITQVSEQNGPDCRFDVHVPRLMRGRWSNQPQPHDVYRVTGADPRPLGSVGAKQREGLMQGAGKVIMGTGRLVDNCPPLKCSEHG